MSRHELAPHPNATGITRAVVGWDRPLRTFFAQVFIADEQEGERTLLWEGAALGEIGAASTAIALVAPYAIVPGGLDARLEAEKRDSFDQRDGPEQMAMKRLLR